jgi:EmrB/QacA subfamily drug resistance transporter
MTTSSDDRKRWLAFFVVCIGTLMIVLDTTIVNVALPSIRTDLGFSETSLVWVINAYMLTFGGFLLLGGRLGDLYGHRRLFVAGLVLFTLASLVCGLATTQVVLITARAVQGLGGAVVDAIALSLIMNLFDAPGPRAKAMGVYGFVCAAGGSIGVLLGGLLTHALSWHWIFLVNIPIGVAVAVMCFTLLPAMKTSHVDAKLDVGGAIAVTMALMMAVYAVVDGNQVGWTSVQTILLLIGAVSTLVVFVWIEAHSPAPLMPLRLFRLRQVVVADVIAALWAAAMFAWFFISAQYLQLVLGYDAREVGLAFLPSNVIMAIFSVGISAKLVTRFGFRGPLAIGLLFAAAGLASFVRAPVAGNFLIDMLPGMLLIGVGSGMAFNPLILAAMSDVDASESGVASGIVNTAFMMGGALGLAILASIAAARTDGLTARGATELVAFNGGYHVAFAAGALSATIAAVLAWLLIRAGAGSASDRPAGH